MTLSLGRRGFISRKEEKENGLVLFLLFILKFYNLFSHRKLLKIRKLNQQHNNVDIRDYYDRQNFINRGSISKIARRKKLNGPATSANWLVTCHLRDQTGPLLCNKMFYGLVDSVRWPLRRCDLLKYLYDLIAFSLYLILKWKCCDMILTNKLFYDHNVY